jgi:uncharacterized protein (DUF58 family)
MKNIYEKIRTLDVVTNRMVTELFSGNYRSSFHGSGIEAEDIRKYEEGDHVRDIDWTTTAKLGEPYIKKYRETRELSTFIIIDVSSSMQFTSKEHRKSDIAVEAAAVLLFSAIKNGEAVGAIIFADEVQKFIPPRKGKRHALRILRDILTAFSSEKPSGSNMYTALVAFNTLVRKHPICFLLTDQETFDEQTRKALSVANLKNDLVYMHVSDPFEHAITDDSSLTLENLEGVGSHDLYLFDPHTRIAYEKIRAAKHTERINILKKLRIDEIQFSTDSNTFSTLFAFFKKRQRRVARS